MKLRSKRSSNEKEKENLRHQKVSQVQQTIHSHQTLTNQEAFNQVYKDLSQPGAFTQKMKKYLNSNITHSLHKSRRKKFKRRRIITYYPYQIVQMDLMDLQQIAGNNSNYKYVLLSIDCFSKKILLRKLKTKTGTETAEAIKSIILDMDWPPQTVTFDEGLEFYNKYVNMLFAQYNIHFYSIRTSTKAGAAERAIRTIKSFIWKYFTEHNTKRWVDILSDVQDNYNDSYHRTIKRKPNEVTWKNRKAVFKSMFPEIEDRVKCKLKEGNKVRVAIYKDIFIKGYTQNWSKEIYTISKVSQRAGVCWYKIKDAAGTVYPKLKYFYDLNVVAEK